MKAITDASDGATLSFTQPSGVMARVQHVLHRYPAVSPALVLLLSGVVFTMLGNGRFQRPETMGIILQQTAVLAVLAIGQTLIILTAGVDLAVGTAMLLTHLVIAKVAVDHGVPGVLALLLGAVVGISLGAFHGGLVTKIGLPPFIVTLGTFYIFNSLGLVYSKAQTISKEDLGGEKSLLLWTGRQISLGSLKITTGVLLVLVMYVVFAFILANTAWGRHVYATGDDREAARLAGIDVDRVLVSVYMVAGLIYAIGGWVQLGRSLSASSNAASDINLESITAVVIGGTSLFGGRGRLWGTLIGALIVTVFRIGLNLAGVNPYYQNFAIGALILVAVTLDQWIRRVGK
jgi:fructose transport system permease protein